LIEEEKARLIAQQIEHPLATVASELTGAASTAATIACCGRCSAASARSLAHMRSRRIAAFVVRRAGRPSIVPTLSRPSMSPSRRARLTREPPIERRTHLAPPSFDADSSAEMRGC
jgi:hypothetical protein